METVAKECASPVVEKTTAKTKKRKVSLIRYGELKLQKKIYDLTKQVAYWRNEAYSARPNPWRTLPKDLNRMILTFLGGYSRLDYLYVVLGNQVQHVREFSDNKYAITKKNDKYEIYHLYWSSDTRLPRNPKNLIASDLNSEQVLRLFHTEVRWGWFSEVYDPYRKRVPHSDLVFEYSPTAFLGYLSELGTRRFMMEPPGVGRQPPIYIIKPPAGVPKQPREHPKRGQLVLDLLQIKVKVE